MEARAAQSQWLVDAESELMMWADDLLEWRQEMEQQGQLLDLPHTPTQ